MKFINKLFKTFIIPVIMIISSMPTFAMTNATYRDAEVTGYYIIDGTGYQHSEPGSTRFRRKEIKSPNTHGQWKTAFCIEPGVATDNGDLMEEVQTAVGGLEQIAYFGYYIQESNMNYVNTQALIYETLQGLPPRMVSTGNYDAFKADVLGKVHRYNLMPNLPTTTIDIDVPISIDDPNGALQDYHTFDFMYDGVRFQHSYGWNNLVVTATSNASEKVFLDRDTAKANGAYKYDTVSDINIVVKSQTKQNLLSAGHVDPFPLRVQLNVNLYGSLKLAKLDDKGNYVPNTTFITSYNSDFSAPAWDYTTGDDGTVTIDKWKPGKVYIQEVSVPNHLVLDNTVHTMDIVPNSTVTFTATNSWKVGEINLTKVDKDTGNMPQGAGTLDGAKYTLYANNDILNPSDNSVIYHKDEVISPKTINTGTVGDTGLKTIDSNHHIQWTNLALGDYYVKETVAPQGYMLDTTKHEVTIKTLDNSAVISQNVISKEEVTTTNFVKKDVDNNYLHGGQFQVVDKSNMNVIDTWDNDGRDHIVKGLAFNKPYIYQELESPMNYATAQDIEFTITQNNEVIEMKDPQVTFQKLDEKGQLLKGATMQVTNNLTKNIVDEFVTGEETNYIQNLVVGQEYTITEIKSPTGYYVADPIVFKVTEENQVLTMVDKPILTDIKVNKVDSATKEAITSKDFEFTLFTDKECKEKLKTVNADTTTGTATFLQLPYGTYYIKETAAPKGYELSSEVKEIVINDDLEGVGDIHSFEYENIQLPSLFVATGDHKDIVGLILIMCSSLFLIITIIISKK